MRSPKLEQGKGGSRAGGSPFLHFCLMLGCSSLPPSPEVTQMPLLGSCRHGLCSLGVFHPQMHLHSEETSLRQTNVAGSVRREPQVVQTKSTERRLCPRRLANCCLVSGLRSFFSETPPLAHIFRDLLSCSHLDLGVIKECKTPSRLSSKVELPAADRDFTECLQVAGEDLKIQLHSFQN